MRLSIKPDKIFKNVSGNPIKKLGVSWSPDYMKLNEMTPMKSIMANAEELLEYATPNTWPILNTVGAKNWSFKFWIFCRKEFFKISWAGDYWMLETVEGNNFLNKDSGPIHFRSVYSLFKKATNIICEHSYPIKKKRVQENLLVNMCCF